MRKIRGFRLGRKAVQFWKWLAKARRRRPSKEGYLRLNPAASTSRPSKSMTMTKICSWGRRLTQRLRTARRFVAPARDGCGYARMDEAPITERAAPVPKGHLAVYVDEKDGDPHRFLVPVLYFNHPLFGELLREAEEQFGFHHPGGITIPCRVSDFETVQTRIAGEGDRRGRR